MSATDHAPLLIEIGCEEIPARMISRGAESLRERVVEILDRAALTRGKAIAWGGSRRLAVYVDDVQGMQAAREELLLGPPAKIAFDEQGRPTRALEGFARKQGVELAELAPVETEKGIYAGTRRSIGGKSLEQILAATFHAAVAGMSFPKTMRWADGGHRWVRPVHWLLALHGERPLSISLFGVEGGSTSRSHRFLGQGELAVRHAERYADTLRTGFVLVDPAERRARLQQLLVERAEQTGGRLHEDPELLEETADLVEWPDVVQGTFDEGYLELPREVLVTTLRHHQKCFSVVRSEDPDALLPAFLAVANTDRDPGGHIRRGNEWVIGGRLEDARFFWAEDLKTPLAEHAATLERVVFQAEVGSYAAKAERVGRIAGAAAEAAGLAADVRRTAETAGELCKHDLVTGLVGEFPELQGVVGGLLLAAQGGDAEVAQAIYAHYRPAGQGDPLPDSEAACVVSVADKLDTIASLIGAGESPTGSRDPFGLRRAANGVFRVVVDRKWPLSLESLWRLTGDDNRVFTFLRERLERYLRDAGGSINEVRAVELGARGEGFSTWTLSDIRARIDALRPLREREDFARLVELTKRVDNILVKGAEIVAAGSDEPFEESARAALALSDLLDKRESKLESAADKQDYPAVIDGLAEFVDPVAGFFDDVLVLDKDNPGATRSRAQLLQRLRNTLTRCFDIRELAGQAERRA